jgi:hypothetical protein
MSTLDLLTKTHLFLAKMISKRTKKTLALILIKKKESIAALKMASFLPEMQLRN